MTTDAARKIGAKQGLISVFFGMAIAYLMMTFLMVEDYGFISGFLWILKVEYWYHILIGCCIMILSGYFYGQIAGKAILIGNSNSVLVGFLTGMAVLLTTGFLGGITGFLEEGINNIGTHDNPFFDYLIKPLFWIAFFGLIPSLIVGIIFGKQIKRKGKQLKESTAHNNI